MEKPKVKVKKWGIIHNRLVGIAIDHPKRPGERDIISSPIVAQNVGQGWVETKNTMYELVGEPEA